jgi:hypothetical protein
VQPILDETKQGKRTVLFVDAAHFVMGIFLGRVWCLVRLLLPSANGCKRHNVLGANDPITHEAITVTNDNSVVYAAQDEHAIEAEQHLEQATESGKKGDAKGAAAHTEEAQKHVIEENKEKPYPPQTKQITGEKYGSRT